MADFGGFDIPTVQEALSNSQAFQQKAALSGNAQVMRAANIQSTLDTLFGNPQLNVARKIQSRLQSLQQAGGTEQNPGESDLDYQLRRLAATRDAVADVSPQTAAQINGQILKLGEMKFQRELLTAQNTRAEAANTREQTQFDIQKPALEAEAKQKALTGNLTYVMKTSPLGNVDVKAFNLSDPTATADFAKAMQEPNAFSPSAAQIAEIYKSTSSDAARFREALARANAGLGKNTWNDIAKQGGSLIELYGTVDRILNVFKENPDALSVASKGAKALDNVSSQLNSAARVVNGNTTANGSSIDNWMKANNVTNSRMQGLVIGVAFAIAKAQNGTGRITDRDLLAAKETIGADNPNPVVMLSNLHDILVSKTGPLMDQIQYLNADNSAPPFVRAMQQTLGNKQQAFDNQWKEYTKGRFQEAAGDTSTSPTVVPNSSLSDEALLKKWGR